MKTWERYVTLAGTGATLAMAFDFYVLRSRLTTVLATPVQVPAAALLIAVFLIGFVVLLARAPLPKLQSEVWSLRAERSGLAAEVHGLRERIEAADAGADSLKIQAAGLQSRLDHALALHTVVAAVLVKADADEQEIMNGLKRDYYDKEERHLVLAALGALIAQGRIVRAKYGQKYHWVGPDEASAE